MTDVFRCSDNSYCHRIYDGNDCCRYRGGSRIQCPSNLPVMCQSMTCSGMNCCASQHCNGALGGVRPPYSPSCGGGNNVAFNAGNAGGNVAERNVAEIPESPKLGDMSLHFGSAPMANVPEMTPSLGTAASGQMGCCYTMGYGAMMVPCCQKPVPQHGNKDMISAAQCPTASRVGGKTEFAAGVGCTALMAAGWDVTKAQQAVTTGASQRSADLAAITGLANALTTHLTLDAEKKSRVQDLLKQIMTILMRDDSVGGMDTASTLPSPANRGGDIPNLGAWWRPGDDDFALKGAGEALGDTFGDVKDAVSSGAAAAWDAGKGAAGWVGENAGNAAGAVGDAVGSAVGAAGDAVDDAKDWMTGEGEEDDDAEGAEAASEGSVEQTKATAAQPAKHSKPATTTQPADASKPAESTLPAAAKPADSEASESAQPPVEGM